MSLNNSYEHLLNNARSVIKDHNRVATHTLISQAVFAQCCFKGPKAGYISHFQVQLPKRVTLLHWADLKPAYLRNLLNKRAEGNASHNDIKSFYGLGCFAFEDDQGLVTDVLIVELILFQQDLKRTRG